MNITIKNNNHLYLIDGHAIAYRAYFGTIKNQLTNEKGMPTGAIFAFAQYLLRLITTYKCPYIAVVFDSPVPTFRHQMYSEYKANRVAMPDDLKVQMPFLFKLVEVFNIPMIRQDGLEADDIIATLTKTAVTQGFTVSLVTRDKDLMQLVGDTVHLLAPENAGMLDTINRPEVIEKMGVPPEKIRDLLALMGDSSDNVPGVPGVGPKTAITILEAAGSVDALLENPSLAGNAKLADKISANKELLLLSQKLVTLKDDAELTVTINNCASRPFHREECALFFREMGFDSLLRNPLFEVRTTLSFTARTAQTLIDVETMVRSIQSAGFVSIDTETTSTEPRAAKLVGISCAVNETEALYIPVGHSDVLANLDLTTVLDILRPVIESPSIAKIGQNLKYDYQIFKNYNLKLAGIAFDTMIAAYLIDPGKRQYNLEALATEWINCKCTSIETLIGKGKDQINFADVPVEKASTYSGEDVVLPLILKKLFDAELIKKNLATLFTTIEMPLVTVLAEMEWAGIALDATIFKSLSVEFTQKLGEISQSIYALAGQEFNLNSPKQVSEVLFVKLGLPHSKKTETGFSTNVDVLEKLAPDYPIAQTMLDYREIQKLLSTYIDALPQEVSPVSNRVHTSFQQTIAATGRLSSINPNLQNIPIRTDSGRRIREAFIAQEGYVLISADYSQIELRLLAHLSGDPVLVQAFLDDADIHTQTASAMYGCFAEMVTPEMRRAAKTINFGLMYGMGPVNLSRQLKISIKEAQHFIDKYFEQFASIKRYMQQCIDQAKSLGYTETLFGRRRYVPDITADNRMIREGAERVAINTPVQGTAADIIKIAMITIAKELGHLFPGARMLLQVHDELVFESPEKDADSVRAWVIEKMSGACKLSVPLKVDAGVGKSWSLAH